GLLGDHLGDALARAQDLLRLDGDVGGGAAGAAAGLMDHEARIRQAQAPLPGRREEDVRAGARHPPGAHGGDRRAHETDDVVDRIAGFDVAAGDEISTVIGASESSASAMRRVHVARATAWLISPNSMTKRDLKARR